MKLSLRKKIIADKSNLITLSRYLLFFGSQGAEKIKSQKRFESKKLVTSIN